MKSTTTIKWASTLAMLAASALCAQAVVSELIVNGGFETGDTTGWTEFPPGPTATFNVTTDANSGTFAGELFNNIAPSGFVVKQANLGAGLLTPGATVTVSFSAKEVSALGGVIFAELFSEIDGGGTSKSEILGGAPLFAPGTYTPYSFTTTLGPDVSGGVTLQFVAATGADPGSTALAFIDDVSLMTDVVPEPASASLLGLAGLLLLARRRR